MERSLAALERAGAQLVEVTVPDAPAMAELSRAIVYAEATALHGAWLRERPDDYSPQVRVRASTGLAIPASIYLEALTLPLYYDLTDDQQQFVIASLREIVG